MKSTLNNVPVAAILAMWLTLATEGSAVIAQQEQLTSEARRVLDGIRDSRLGLKRGAFELKGELVRIRDEEQSRMELSGTVEFDDSYRLVRCVFHPGTQMTRRVLLRSEGLHYWMDTGRLNNVVRLSSPDAGRDAFTTIVDARTAGLSNWNGLFCGRTLDATIDHFLTLDVVECRLESGKTVLALKNGLANIQTELIVDEANHFVVDSVMIYDVGKGDRDELYRTECRWEAMNGTMVPIDMQFSSNTKSRYEGHLKLSWSDVNGPEPPAKFTLEELGIPQGVQVIEKQPNAKR